MNSNNSGWLGHLKTWSGPAALILVIVALVVGILGLSLPKALPGDPGGIGRAATGQACGVYMEQGCMQLTVQSGGEIQMESGSTLDVQSGTTSTFGGALTVSGATALNGGLTMDTNKFTVADTSGNVATAGTLQLTGTGGLYLNGNYLYLDSGDLDSISTDGTYLTVDLSNAADELNINRGNVTIGNATPSVAVNGEDLFVEGTSEFDGAMRADGSVTVAGSSALNGGITVDTSNFTVSGTTGAVSTASNLTVGGTAKVTGATTITGTLTAVGTVAAADVTVSDDVTITDRLLVGSNFSVDSTGALYTNIITGAVGNFTLDGSANLYTGGAISTDSDITAGGDLTVSGSTLITGSLTVNGDKFTVDAAQGNTIVTGTLDVNSFASFSIEPTIITTDTLLTTAMKGDWQVLQNSGALTVTLTLPAAAAGLQYCVFNYDGDDVMVDPQAGDQIFSLTNAAGDRILNTTAGNSICLLAIDNTYWLALYPVGTWSDAD